MRTAISRRVQFVLCFLGTLASSFQVWGAEHCYFVPPSGWELANPETYSPRVKIAFLGKNSKGLPPSINLATEATDVSLKVYIDAVKATHAVDPNSRWRDLGKFNTALGEGRLCELETQTPYGAARIVQLIVMWKNIVYILTASALKEEFSHYYKEFEKALGSLQHTQDLTLSIPDIQKQTVLHKLVQELQSDLNKVEQETVPTVKAFETERFQTKSWKPFQEKIIHSFTEMGSYWQILFLQEIQTNLLNSEVKK